MIASGQRQQLQAVLLAAFSLDELRRLVRLALDQDLDAISAGDLRQRVNDVVEYAERSGRLADLAATAIRQNPDNEQIKALTRHMIDLLFEQKKTSFWKLPRVPV